MLFLLLWIVLSIQMNVSPRKSILLDIMGGKDLKLCTFGRWLKNPVLFFLKFNFSPHLIFQWQFNDLNKCSYFFVKKSIANYLKSESEWALLPGMFTHTRNLFSWQKLPQCNRMTATEQKHIIKRRIKKNKQTRTNNIQMDNCMYRYIKQWTVLYVHVYYV